MMHTHLVECEQVLTRKGRRKVQACLTNLSTLTGAMYFASFEKRVTRDVLYVLLTSRYHTATLPLMQGLDY